MYISFLNFFLRLFNDKRVENVNVVYDLIDIERVRN